MAGRSDFDQAPPTRRFVIGCGGAATLSSLLPASAFAKEIVERADLAALFQRYKLRGTFAAFDVTADRFVVFDLRRARHRMIPASTFKIANSLIALETGVVKDENEIIPFGGKPQPFKDWERDMSMREAIKGSVVPIYHELARRIGLERYREWLPRLEYGNCEVGNVVDRFWLDGPLMISAIEETEFAARLALKRLAASQRSQEIVRDILRLETVGGATLYAKTGWGQAVKPDVGWLAGWVERGAGVHAFALNVDLGGAADAAKRIPLAKELLSAVGGL